MDYSDRQAIDALFGKLADAERQTGPRDAEAETYIRDRIATQPAAPYLMAQTVVIQEQALNAAQQRIEELEYELSTRQSSSGGFFASLFGNSSQPRSAPPRMPPPPQAPGMASPQANPGPWGRSPVGSPQPQGGGFLAGAAQTAMGVAGGVLLGNAIAGMFGADTAHAAENKNEDEDKDQQDDGADDGGDDSFFDL
jgi:hypothetical protein